MLRALLALALATAACSAPAKGGPTRPAGGGDVLPQDQSFTLKDIEVRGVVFEPQALGLPVMTQVTGRGKTTLDRLRKKVARKNPDADDVHQLATALWAEASAAAGDPARATQLREEARSLLRKLKASMGTKADALTL